MKRPKMMLPAAQYGKDCQGRCTFYCGAGLLPMHTMRSSYTLARALLVFQEHEADAWYCAQQDGLQAHA